MTSADPRCLLIVTYGVGYYTLSVRIMRPVSERRHRIDTDYIVDVLDIFTVSIFIILSLT
jgi:hypothetical protein